MHTTGGWVASYAWARYIIPAVLSADIVNSTGDSVASPSVTMSSISSNSSCQATTGTLGSSSQKIRVSNGTTNASWSLSIAATGGPTANWSATTEVMDYNDGASVARSLWDNTAVPDINTNESTPVELGLKFNSSVAGVVQGVRFYKSTINTGTHVGRLWDMNGNELAQVEFANETASGWQEAFFSVPIEIAANTDYIVSYFNPTGRFSVDNNYFANFPHSRYPLTAPSNISASGPNGVFQYGSGGVFPTGNYAASNYWVDVIFDAPNVSSGCGDGTDSDPTAGRLTVNPSASTITPESSCSSTGVSLSAASSFSESESRNSIGLVNAGASAQRGCYWDVTNVGLSQQIPAHQMPGTYALPLTITVTAN